MARKRSKASTQKNVLTALFIVVAIFALMVVIIPQFTVDPDANKSMYDFVTWFVNLRDHFVDFVALYAFLLALLGTGYYFLVYKPKSK